MIISLLAIHDLFIKGDFMNNKFKYLLIGLILLILCLAPVSANNWLMFQHDAKHSGYVDESSEFVSNLWDTDLKSSVISSPAIVNDTIYVVTHDGILNAIDMEDGDILWTYDFEDKFKASPVIKGDTLYIGSMDGTFYALNISDDLDDDDHDEIWKERVDEAIESTAVISGERVYFGSNDGHVYAFSTDGDEKWDYKLGGKVKSSPVIVDDELFAASTNAKVVSLDKDDGSKNWIYTCGDEVLSSPAVTKDNVVVGSVDANVYTLNRDDGELNWTANMEYKIASSPSVESYDNNVYISNDNGNVTCFDLRDGTFKWSYKTDASVRTTPAMNDNYIVVGSNDGNVYQLNKYTGEKIFSYNPGAILFNSEISASPVLYGDNLFVADHRGHIYSIDLNKQDTPFSIFLVFSLVIACIALVLLYVIIKKIRGREKNNGKSKRSLKRIKGKKSVKENKIEEE